MKTARTIAVATALVAGLTLTGWSQDSVIRSRTQAFLDAYANGDRDGIASLIDPRRITMYGSDKAEFAQGAEAVYKLMSEDHQLWGRAVHFGAMEHESLVREGSMASIAFDIPFVLGGRPPIPIRVVAIWKREGKRWLLVQSSNAVVTEHQSASELLQHP